MDTENSNVFSSYFDASSHISTYSNLQECEENCKNQVDCLGIVETQEPATQCLLVNALGQAQQTEEQATRRTAAVAREAQEGPQGK